MSRSRLTCLALLLALGGVSRTAHAGFHRFTYTSGAQCKPGAPRNDNISYSERGIKVLDQLPPTPAKNPISLICPVPWSQDNPLPWTQTAQMITIQLYMTRDPLPQAAAISTTPPPDPGCMAMALGPAGSMVFIPQVTIIDPGTDSPIYVLQQTQEMPLGTVFSTALYCDGVVSGTSIVGYSIDICFDNDLSSC